MRAAGGELDTWSISADADPPADPAGYDAVLTYGGAMHADQEDEHPWLAAEKRLLADLLERGVPLFGVCLGAQLLGEAAGVPARRSTVPEIGWFEVEVTAAGRRDPVMGPLAPSFEAFGWHSYECPLPPGAVPLAGSETCLQAFRIGATAWGIQFHAEVSAADAESWIRHYDTDPDAVAAGIDPQTLWSETRPRLERWNRLGRDIASRFLATLQGSDPKGTGRPAT
ncbi:MAG TPA: type 1 glutamine amidotransferase [Solirubrobacterales bacterium]